MVHLLSLWLFLLFELLPRRSSFWCRWPRHAVWVSSRLFLGLSPFLAPMFFSLTFRSFERRLSRLSTRFLAPFVFALWIALLVTFLTNFFNVLFVRYMRICPGLPPLRLVLALFLCLLALLLALSLRMLLASFFVMSSPVLILLHLLILRLLLLLLRGLIQYVGWLLRGLLRAMLLCLQFWLRLLGPLLLSSLPSIFLTSSFLHLRVLVWALLWLQIPWCKFLLVWFLSLFVHSLQLGVSTLWWGRVLSLLRSSSCSSLR